MKTSEFINIYKTDPCRYSATALWKTFSNDGVVIDATDDADGIKTIKMHNDTTLFLYWDRDNDTPTNIDKYETCLFHVKQLKGLDTIKEYSDSYFRLKYSGDKPYIKNTNYVIKTVDITKEAKLASEFISKCYKDLCPSEQEVIYWAKNPVYSSELWIWTVGDC